MKPETGRHLSHPVVEKSWDAIFLNTMQDWNKYVERPYQEVLEELKAEGYQVVSDGLIACYRNVDLQKGDFKIRLVCAPFDLDDFDEKLNDKERTHKLDDVDWYTFEIHDEEGNLLTDD